MSAESPEGFDFSHEEMPYILEKINSSEVPYESPIFSKEQVILYGLNSCLGIIGVSKESENLAAQHIKDPNYSDVKNFVSDSEEEVEELEVVFLSGINFRSLESEYNSDSVGLTDYSTEEILSKSPKEVLENTNGSSRNLTYLEEFILKRGQAEKACEDLGIHYFPYWSEDPDQTTSIMASIPEAEIAVSHSNPFN